MRISFMYVAATAASLVASAKGDIAYVSGIQTSTGTVEVHPVGVPTSQSYDIAAPNPLMSWTPPDQSVSVSVGLASAAVHSSYASTLDATQLTLHAAADSNAHEAAMTTFAQTTTISMTFSAPTTVYLSAHIVRQSLMNISIMEPMFLRFGRDGDTPILNFAYAGEQHWDASFPGTQLVLDPGTYTLSAFNHVRSEINGHVSDPFFAGVDFSLTVPAPASVSVLLLVTAGGLRRRSRLSPV